MVVQGNEIEFNEGLNDLHTLSYELILQGKGFGITEAKPSIQIVHDIRHARPIGLKGSYHPLASLTQKPHPFREDH